MVIHGNECVQANRHQPTDPPYKPPLNTIQSTTSLSQTTTLTILDEESLNALGYLISRIRRDMSWATAQTWCTFVLTRLLSKVEGHLIRVAARVLAQIEGAFSGFPTPVAVSTILTREFCGNPQNLGLRDNFRDRWAMAPDTHTHKFLLSVCTCLVALMWPSWGGKISEGLMNLLAFYRFGFVHSNPAVRTEAYRGWSHIVDRFQKYLPEGTRLHITIVQELMRPLITSGPVDATNPCTEDNDEVSFELWSQICKAIGCTSLTEHFDLVVTPFVERFISKNVECKVCTKIMDGLCSMLQLNGCGTFPVLETLDIMWLERNMPSLICVLESALCRCPSQHKLQESILLTWRSLLTRFGIACTTANSCESKAMNCIKCLESHLHNLLGQKECQDFPCLGQPHNPIPIITMLYSYIESLVTTLDRLMQQRADENTSLCCQIMVDTACQLMDQFPTISDTERIRHQQLFRAVVESLPVTSEMGEKELFLLMRHYSQVLLAHKAAINFPLWIPLWRNLAQKMCRLIERTDFHLTHDIGTSVVETLVLPLHVILMDGSNSSNAINTSVNDTSEMWSILYSYSVELFSGNLLCGKISEKMVDLLTETAKLTVISTAAIEMALAMQYTMLMRIRWDSLNELSFETRGGPEEATTSYVWEVQPMLEVYSILFESIHLRLPGGIPPLAVMRLLDSTAKYLYGLKDLTRRKVPVPTAMRLTSAITRLLEAPELLAHNLTLRFAPSQALGVWRLTGRVPSDTRELSLLAPLISLGLSSKSDNEKCDMASFWNNTFGTIVTDLEYPSWLVPILQQSSIPLSLPLLPSQSPQQQDAGMEAAGAVSNLHSTSASSTQTLVECITEWKERGYDLLSRAHPEERALLGNFALQIATRSFGSTDTGTPTRH
ncbi:hypothetical protein Pelo_17214 [Pelomyxa schiedti]|nr:hypothetical protein Pelo_17214 [Pelomyxa schiedti]